MDKNEETVHFHLNGKIKINLKEFLQQQKLHSKLETWAILIKKLLNVENRLMINFKGVNSTVGHLIILFVRTSVFD